MIVTIDGPAGAGKSSVSRRLAEVLGFDFLDTGAMYRCVTLACIRRKISPDDLLSTADVAVSIQIELGSDRVKLDGEDVTDSIRAFEVTRAIKSVADNPQVRDRMVHLQRSWAEGKQVVTEGRDQGTIAFPNADRKIFLTASPAERARRRVNQLIQMGATADFNEILAQQNQRDAEDTQRPVGALRQASDAIPVVTDGLSEDQVLERLLAIVNSPVLASDERSRDRL